MIATALSASAQLFEPLIGPVPTKMPAVYDPIPQWLDLDADGAPELFLGGRAAHAGAPQVYRVGDSAVVASDVFGDAEVPRIWQGLDLRLAQVQTGTDTLPLLVGYQSGGRYDTTGRFPGVWLLRQVRAGTYELLDGAVPWDPGRWFAELRGLQASDVDEDGLLDLVLFVSGVPPIRLELQPDGTWERYQEATGRSGELAWTVAGDFDGDGDLDLVGSRVLRGMSSLETFAQTPAGTFTRVSSGLFGARCRRVLSLGPSDSAAHGILAISTLNGDSTRLVVWRPDGARRFTAVDSIELAVETEDAYGANYAAGHLAVLRAAVQGETAFMLVTTDLVGHMRAERLDLPARDIRGGIGLVEYDGAGHLDAVASSYSDADGRRQEAMLGDLAHPFRFRVAEAPLPSLRLGDYLVGDFTGDGRDDLVAAGTTHAPDDRLGLFPGGLGARRDLIAGDSTLRWLRDGSALAGDLDGDGDLDLVLAALNAEVKRRVQVLLNGGDGWFAPQPGAVDSLAHGGLTALYDADGDGDLDFYLAGYPVSSGGSHYASGARTGLYLNDGDASFTLSAASWLPTYDQDGTVPLDLDRDGVYEVVHGSRYQSSPRVYSYGADSTYRFEAYLAETPGGLGSGGIRLDLDRDGLPELLTWGWVSVYQGEEYPYTHLYRVVADTLLRDRAISLPGLGFGAWVAGDVNGDGHVDLVGVGDARGCDGEAHILLGDGHGGLRYVGPQNLVGSYSTSVSLIDVDGDGRLDVVASGKYVSTHTTQVRVWRNTGMLVTSWVSDIIPDGAPSEQLFVYPNPIPARSGAAFSIRTDLTDRTARVHVYDLQGRLRQMETTELTEGVAVLRLSDGVVAGTYLLVVEGARETLRSGLLTVQ